MRLDKSEEFPVIRRKREQVELLKLLAMASSMGISIVLATVIGLAIGYYLDNHIFDTSPWLTLVFLMFGIVAGFRNIYIIGKRAQKKSEEIDEQRASSSPSEDK